MKQTNVFYYLILDVSYSMEMIWELIRSQIIRHLKTLNKLQKTQAGSLVKYRLVTFNQEVLIYPLEEEIEKISTVIKKLVPEGQSALFDALGFVLKIVKKDLDANQTEKYNYNHILVLLTDGGDNASKEYDYESITIDLLATKTSCCSNFDFNLIGINPGFKSVFNILQINGFPYKEFNQEELKLSFSHLEQLIESKVSGQ